MYQQNVVCRIVLAACLSLLCLSLAHADATRADFARWDVERQKRVIYESLVVRRQALQNAEMTSVTVSTTYQYAEGVVGAAVGVGSRTECHIKRVNGSYWLSARLFSGSRPDVVSISSYSNFDEQIGESRNLMLENGGRQTLFARIDAKADDTVQLDDAAYHVLGWPDGDKHNVWNLLLDQRDEWTIEAVSESGEVTVSYPYAHDVLAEFELEGKCSVVVDLERRMAPIRMEVDCRAEVHGTTLWRKETILCGEFSECDGVWIPRKFRRTIRALPVGEDRCVISETEIQSVSIGNVKMAELAIEFPEDTQVTDAIRGVSWKMGAGGQPRGQPEPLVNVADLSPKASNATTAPGRSSSRWVIWFNVAILGALVMLFVVRYLRGRGMRARKSV